MCKGCSLRVSRCVVRYRACDSPSRNLRGGGKIHKIVRDARECFVLFPCAARDSAGPWLHRHPLRPWAKWPRSPGKMRRFMLRPIDTGPPFQNAVNPRSGGCRAGVGVTRHRVDGSGVIHLPSPRFSSGEMQEHCIRSLNSRSGGSCGLLHDLAGLSREQCFELLKASLEHFDLIVFLGAQVAERLDHQGSR